MTIGCVRCGASQEGDIILPSIAFAFKHERGCGHGIGPLCIIKGKTPKKLTTKEFKDKPKKKKSKELKEGDVPWEKSDTESTVSITTPTENEITTTTTTEKGT